MLKESEHIKVILERVLKEIGILEILDAIYTNTLGQTKPFLNLTELSEYLKLSKHSIYSLVSRGELPVYKRTRHLMFSRKEIDRWVLDKKYKVHSKKEIKSMASIQQLRAK